MMTPTSPFSNDNNGSHNDVHGPQRRKTVSRWIQWMESLTLPQCCARRLPSSIRNRGASNEDDDDDDQTIHMITGLERVLYGTQPAAEVVQIVGIHPPRYLCYMVSGFVCDVLQFGVDFLLYHNVTNDASLCWMLSFGGSVAVRHTTHRYLVFGDYVGGYWRSLGRMYAGYSVIIVLSTAFNVVMTKYIHVPHAFAWIFTMLWTGIVNYFILKKLWSFGGNGTTKIKTGNETDQEQELAPMLRSRSPSRHVETTA
jgi:hypothetical protein